MLKSLILFTLVLNITFAKERMSPQEKNKFFEDLKQEIAEFKVENRGRVDLQIIKPRLYEELETFADQGKLTPEEVVRIKQNYEAFSRSPGITPANSEDALYKFMQKEFEAVNATIIEKKKEGGLCRRAEDCESGSVCVEDEIQMAIGQAKKAGSACLESSECASGICAEEKYGSKNKVCGEVSRCHRILREGDSCNDNPACPLKCRPENIPFGAANGASCKEDLDCSSLLCVNEGGKGVCQENKVCTACRDEGQIPQRGQQCCNGLYPGVDGRCMPMLKPHVPRKVEVTPMKTIFMAFASFFISTADAGEIENAQKSFDQLLAKYEDSPVGTSFQWGEGKIKILPTGNLLYTPNNGGKSVELTEKTNIIKAARKSEELRQSVIQTYGIDPLGTSSSNASNKNVLSTLQKEDTKRTNTTSNKTSVNVPGFGNVTLTYARTEGSGDSQTEVPSSITSSSGKVYTPASAFFSSNEYAAMTGSKLNSDDYKFLAEEVEAATKTANSAPKKSEAEELEDEEKFLDLGVKNDGLDLKSGVMSDKEKYSNFQAESKKGKALNMEEKKVKMNFERKSDFATCDIRFRDDFYNALKADGTMDFEIAMLGFDFVMGGEADSDYWTTNGSPETSIYNRLKAVSIEHRKQRVETNKKIEDITQRLTCMCLDAQGYTKITDATKKKFFETSCEEYSKYANQTKVVCTDEEYAKRKDDPTLEACDELDGDASGLKAKRLLTVWTSNLQSFHASLTVDNSAMYSELSKIANWANGSAKWNEAKTRKYELFKFNIKNPSGSVAALGALIGALLAAGVIAILGGFATSSILSAWVTAGIITASAATGAGGLWMIASLKGAWITLGPRINDADIPPRTYSCGKKESCTEYTRTLVQPYNDVCKIHASSNACLKSFVVVNEEGEPRYIVDPWIPAGVSKAAILVNQPLYAEQIEKGFEAAKNAMIMKNPGATGGGGKKGGGNFVSELYLSEVFIDANILGQYLPRLGADLNPVYFMNRDKIKLIKDAAKEFAIKEGFLLESEKENLEEFANYAYEYHFLWPKKSRPEEISYPTSGLTTYLDYMAQNVSGELTTGLADTAKKLNKLNEQYLKDYLNNLKLYAQKPSNQESVLKKSLLGKEIDKTQKALDTLLTMNAMLDNSALDSQLTNLGTSFIADQAKLAGANGAMLSDGQASFLKAVGKLREARKDQLKSLDAYNKYVAGSGNKGLADKINSSASKFSKKFATGNAAMGSGSGSLLSDSSSSGSGGDKSQYNGGFGNGAGAGAGIGAGGTIDYGSAGTGALFGSGLGSSSRTSGTGAGASYSGSYGRGGMSADQSKISEAIDARNKSQNKYQSTDGLTLFEKVTNAYIRNYDKVLQKKKDKDVIEDKE